MSINLERTLEDHNIPEGLQYENLIEYYLCKGIIVYAFLYPDIIQHYKSLNSLKQHDCLFQRHLRGMLFFQC